jgi:hypothetical protein
MYFPINGCTWNKRNAPMKIVMAKSEFSTALGIAAEV